MKTHSSPQVSNQDPGSRKFPKSHGYSCGMIIFCPKQLSKVWVLNIKMTTYCVRPSVGWPIGNHFFKNSESCWKELGSYPWSFFFILLLHLLLFPLFLFPLLLFLVIFDLGRMVVCLEYLNISIFFLDASMHLYMRACPSVGPSVRPLVGPSVTHFFFNHDFEWKRHRNDRNTIAVIIQNITCPLTIKNVVFRCVHASL